VLKAATIKAGIMAQHSGRGMVYIMGIYPGEISAGAIIGIHERTIFRDYPGRIVFHDTFEVTGSEDGQALALADATRRFYPIAMVMESPRLAKSITSDEQLSTVRVASKIELCVNTHYILSPLFWQAPSLTRSTVDDKSLRALGLYDPDQDQVNDAARHALTFIRRAKQDNDLAVEAWGEYEPERRHVKRGAKRVARPARRR
jgi:hypothetical protein